MSVFCDRMLFTLTRSSSPGWNSCGYPPGPATVR